MRVVISGGKPSGGIASFAEALRGGFESLGIPVEVIPPREIYSRPGVLRDPRVLKILSTTAVFAVAGARSALCIAHAIPCLAQHGWVRTIAILSSFRLAGLCPGAQLIAVSNYTATHLREIFGLRVDAVIQNPLQPVFFELPDSEVRDAIVYVGRLHGSKNIDRLLPSICDVLNDHPELRAWIIGDGPMRSHLERAAGSNSRIEFLGALAPREVRDRLRRARVLISGNPLESFGIVYLEALSQGCALAMPTCGGGVEIAPELIGAQIRLFPPSVPRDEVAATLRAALKCQTYPVQLERFSARSVASAYLRSAARFSPAGKLEAGFPQ